MCPFFLPIHFTACRLFFLATLLEPGDLATPIHCDDLRALMLKGNTVKCLADGAFFMTSIFQITSTTPTS